MSSPIRYIVGLDFLRAIAVLLVLVHHWMPKDSILNVLNNGLMGVTLFFVLSGYLISKILLVQRNHQKFEFWTALKTFYIRRSFRIFPVYYLVVFMVWGFLGDRFSIGLGAYLGYVQNIAMIFTDDWDWVNSHLWSLAVEEQYYLLWPPLLLLSSKRLLIPIIAVFICVGPITRYLGFLILESIGKNPELIHVLTPTAFDCFGLGSLLALFELEHPTKFGKKRSAVVIIIPLIISFIVFVALSQTAYSGVTNRFFFSIFSILLIYLFALPENKRLDRFFGSTVMKPLIHFGKVSYGVYLFHPYVAHVFHDYFYPPIIRYNLGWLYLPKVSFVLLTVIVFVLSSLSWAFFEKPINQLKMKFKY